jgi:hypothetical protein
MGHYSNFIIIKEVNVMLKKRFFLVLAFLLVFAFLSTPLFAKEVSMAAIPADHVAKACKVLPWGVKVWDLEDAVSHLKAKDKFLWLDTRPETFFKKGTVRGAVLMSYNKSGAAGNDMTEDKLAAAIKAAGMTKDSAKLVFFCQGPKCHRSYNAAYIAVTRWGYKAENVVWYRDGYPALFKEVKHNPKIKRKAKRYISDDGFAQLL